jgi:hypothetical protein
VALPLRYMQVLYELTGYWGTYLPTRPLQPGMVGKRTNGMFEQITHLERLPGYDAELLGLQSYEREQSSTEWSSEGVITTALAPKIAAPGKIAEIELQVDFHRSEDALVLLQSVQHHQYTDTRNLKSLLQDLRELGEWKSDYCVITEVIEAKAAWLFFATDTNQSASLKAHTSVLPAAVPDSLKQLVGDAEIAASLGCQNFSGFFTKLPTGGTPLFSALAFKKAWWQLGLGKPEGVMLKGEDQVFEEPVFGEEDR